MAFDIFTCLVRLFYVLFTPWKTNMDPENHWLVENNILPGGPGRQGLC